MNTIARMKKFAPDLRYVPLIDPLTCPLDDASICCNASTDFPFTLFSSFDLPSFSVNDNLEDLVDDLELVRLRFPPVSETFSSFSSSVTSSD